MPSGGDAYTGEGIDRLGGANIWQVIGAAGVGTMIEWYDFYIFGSLALVLSAKFYPAGNETAAVLATLATFAAGFAARPFGALFFGRIGDLVGRKYAFLVTLLIMGGATFVIGLLPSYGTIGLLAPIILVLLRLLQGLALGGEYGGAAVYIAEHVPDNRRGYYTAFIQTTATLGLFLSLLVILGTRETLGEETFNDWGWRVPFLLSILLVGISLFIRLRLRESPLFAHLKTTGRTSTAPVSESFGSWSKWQTVLTVLWGAAAGQAVVWYCGQFYALFWLSNPDLGGVSSFDTNLIIVVALALATPFFIVFGALSDRIGRKPVMMAGNLIAAVTTIPIFALMYRFSPNGGNYQPVILTLCVFVLVLYVTMVYGPIAAFLVESFPARVRYTSVSLPYHVGNGYFGGFLPLISTVVVGNAVANPDAWPVDPQYAGLLYPVTIAAITFVLGTWLLRETRHNRIDAEGHAAVSLRASPVVLTILIGLTVAVLVLADRYITPELNTETFSVQWFFRILVLAIVVAVGFFALTRRGVAAEVAGPAD
ncbi:MAG: MFS transporter [Chloroflexota bacterium]|nr:MFS transporter [Chloroflexota bacterium]